MSVEGHSKPGWQDMVGSTPLLSDIRPKPDPKVTSPVDSSLLNLAKDCSSESKMENRIMQRRNSSARPRLPSFRGLGILSFEPQSNCNKDTPGTYFPVLRGEVAEHSSTRPVDHQLRRTGSTPLLTPPAELDSSKWSNSSTIPLSKSSPSQSRFTLSPHALATSVEGVSLSQSGAHTDNVSLGASGSDGVEPNLHTTGFNPAQPAHGSRESSLWLDRSVGATVVCIDPSNPSSNTVQIVSQTLPSPAKETARPNAIFTEVIAAIQTRFASGAQPYITITHAVPPRFDLLNLPNSPPSTPNLSAARDDYFAQSVFAHAAVVPSYHLPNNSLATPAPSSPNPIVPPSSVQISVLERYVPPSSAQEFKDLFSLTGQSVLIDRLAELSTDNGSMLFVYPTRTGAGTFTSKYLSRILDPLLRALVEVHQLSYGLAESLSSMVAVPEMYEFEALKGKIVGLCRRMTHRITSEIKRSKFDLVYASTGEVFVDRKTWTEWYLKQEHTRFKRTLEGYWGRGRRLSQMDSASAGTVLREFIDGVNKMTNEEAEQTGPAIELGVFVIRRSHLASSS